MLTASFEFVTAVHSISLVVTFKKNKVQIFSLQYSFLFTLNWVGMLNSLWMESNSTRRRSSSGSKLKPSFMEHSCLMGTFRTRCCRSMCRRRCSLRATDASAARDWRFDNYSANLSSVPWCQRVSFTCWRRCRTRLPKPIDGPGTKCPASTFSYWASNTFWLFREVWKSGEPSQA